MTDQTFIETQFPIARLSAESYKERKANLGQTLPRLGKWWGRKPLVLVRASVLGMLMPASADPQKDREVFLRLMTMDDDALWRRRKGTLKDSDLLAEAPQQADTWAAADEEQREEMRQAIWEGLTPDARARLDAKRRFSLSRAQFDALPYDQRVRLCVRPEHLDGPDDESWKVINAHLGTSAKSLSELVLQLGERRFGHRPRIGDCFCGGGSIVFEAARIGCETYGSDLNPVAALLTWGSIHLIGGGRELQQRIREAQELSFNKSDKQVQKWGIEHNQRGWRADAYLYCVEVRPPGCEYAIPLAPTWMIGERSRVIAKLQRQRGQSRLKIDIITEPDQEDWAAAELGAEADGTGTVSDNRVRDPFDRTRSWSIEEIRGAAGLRMWNKSDFVPRPEDVLQERLYCIRWRKPDGARVYLAPTELDLQQERRVLVLLQSLIKEWWDQGIIPERQIPTGGEKTDEPIRTRGWTHWHHLFTPRQLLINGLLASNMDSGTPEIAAARLLATGRLANWNSRLSRWSPDRAKELGMDVFSNQALNTMWSYSVRPLPRLDTAWPLFAEYKDIRITVPSTIRAVDARDVSDMQDCWITDPPYADAINYHELADFFLAWYEKQLPSVFRDWSADSRYALAVRGAGEDFKRSMVEIYSNLARRMPPNGLQLVQFTHQDPSVWADLGMILWAAGLRVTAAWTVATETPAGGTKKGSYVQGTVLLVLRKRVDAEDGFLDEVYPLVEDEVRRQIDSMHELDEKGEPNFGDTDYQLAAYAAALRVLTHYQTLDGQDVGHELFRVRPEPARGRGRRSAAAVEKSRFEQVIDRAIQIACDYLVPRGLEMVWSGLTADEHLYLRALDVESRGERRQGVYQELARGFGVREVKPLLHSASANSTRVRAPTEFARKELGGDGFGTTKLRALLFAIHSTVVDETPESGRRYLKDELRDYWGERQRMIAILDWLAALGQVETMKHWAADSEAAKLLAGRLRSDHG